MTEINGSISESIEVTDTIEVYETIREKIIQQFLTKAETILKTNGYNTDIGSNVFRAVLEIDPEDLPAVIIFPKTEENERKYGLDNLTFIMRIEGLVSYNGNSSIIIEKILGDLRKCFTLTSNYTLITDVFYNSGGTDTYSKKGELTSGCFKELTIKYQTAIGNPYSQT